MRAHVSPEQQDGGQPLYWSAIFFLSFCLLFRHNPFQKVLQAAPCLEFPSSSFPCGKQTSFDANFSLGMRRDTLRSFEMRNNTLKWHPLSLLIFFFSSFLHCLLVRYRQRSPTLKVISLACKNYSEVSERYFAPDPFASLKGTTMALWGGVGARDARRAGTAPILLESSDAIPASIRLWFG